MFSIVHRALNVQERLLYVPARTPAGGANNLQIWLSKSSMSTSAPTSETLPKPVRIVLRWSLVARVRRLWPQRGAATVPGPL